MALKSFFGKWWRIIAPSMWANKKLGADQSSELNKEVPMKCPVRSTSTFIITSNPEKRKRVFGGFFSGWFAPSISNLGRRLRVPSSEKKLTLTTRSRCGQSAHPLRALPKHTSDIPARLNLRPLASLPSCSTIARKGLIKKRNMRPSGAI